MAKESKGSTFFQQLHRLAQRVDTGVGKLQTDLEDKKKETENGQNKHIAAQKLLQDLRKETQDLKQEGLHFVASFEEKGRLFSETLTACQEFLTGSALRLSATEDYMEQYGYKRPPEKEAVSKKDLTDKAANSEKCEEEDGSTKDSETSDEHVESSPVRKEPSGLKDTALERTPRLEDMGISAFTMNMIHKLNTESDRKQDSFINTQIGFCEMDETIPSIFEHNGLTLTPSLWGNTSEKRKTNYLEGNERFIQPNFGKEGQDFNIPFTSSFQTSIQKPNLKLNQQIKNETNPDKDHPAFNMFFTEEPKPSNTMARPTQIQELKDDGRRNSPMAPLFITPGAKQIIKTQKPHHQETMLENAVHSPAIPQFMTPGAKQINKALTVKACEDVKKQNVIQSPVAPVFITPGAKQIKSSSLMDVADRSNTSDDDVDSKRPVRRKVNTELFKDDEPQSPEFTMSLQDLTELTQSFKLKSDFSKPLHMADNVESSTKRSTPVMPEMLSDRLEKVGMLPQANVMPKFTDLNCGDFEYTTFKPMKSKIPCPPKLMGRYRFSNKPDENFPPNN